MTLPPLPLNEARNALPPGMPTTCCSKPPVPMRLFMASMVPAPSRVLPVRPSLQVAAPTCLPALCQLDC